MINEFIERQFEFRSKIAVVGDSVIDEYYKVESNRISPEFPIPVLASETNEPFKICLGGASNVCAQLSNFNFDVDLFSIINKEIKLKTEQIAVNTESCEYSENVSIKKRYYNGDFPLCRIDVESFNYKLNKSRLFEIQNKIIERLFSKSFDVIVFSDYNKGLFFNFENIINKIGEETITIVDPKKGPIDKWKGCTIIKPNFNEAKEISGQEDPKKQCDYFIEKTNCKAVVVTNGGEGIFGRVMGNWFEYRPDVKKNARSVVGAGDCFIAFLAMCMAHSIDIKKAVGLAFDACSVYVNNIYNYPLYPYHLEKSKFIFPRTLSKRDFTLSFANGCFDILHPGHIELLKFAKSKSDKLVVALNSDKSAMNQNKSHNLVNDIEYRKTMISSLEFVDYVVVFNEETPYEVIKQIKPDVIVKGSDWSNPVGSDIAKEVCLFDRVGDYSTTNIIKKIYNNV